MTEQHAIDRLRAGLRDNKALEIELNLTGFSLDAKGITGSKKESPRFKDAKAIALALKNVCEEWELQFEMAEWQLARLPLLRKGKNWKRNAAKRIALIAPIVEMGDALVRLADAVEESWKDLSGPDSSLEVILAEIRESTQRHSQDLNEVRQDLNQMKQSLESRPKGKRNRGVSSEVLDACKLAMENWLDKSKTIQVAADLADRDDQTVLRHIPEVLDIVEPETREKWISLIKVQRKEKYLGKYNGKEVERT